VRQRTRLGFACSLIALSGRLRHIEASEEEAKVGIGCDTERNQVGLQAHTDPCFHRLPLRRPTESRGPCVSAEASAAQRWGC